jgi:glycosyltransferase involved in cell wall biosynthesis
VGPVAAAQLLRKPSIVVVGGYDTANEPEIGYGSMRSPHKALVVRAICRSATALLVNSYAAEEEVRRNVRVSTPIYVVYHGFAAPPPASAGDQREPLVLTIGNVSAESLRRKGHEAFVRAASLVPEAQFVLAGSAQDGTADFLRAIAPKNAHVVGFLEDDELETLRARAAVYVQASIHEGFGCALAESMAAGCIPVVTRRGALPEVVGSVGIVIDGATPEAIAQGVKEALNLPFELHAAAAARIREHFPLSRRRTGLLSLLRHLE